ncbi:Bud site selection protein 6 [Apophysomyces sp. BC1034]|nr:Bud site selection protein 6 [Apophysomyces sp. BC1015]KAG0180730.1 Bud site selection protein 6 [Apophysomyces sp. BC1021]KAG0188731.1 Bud site selection protein 6 [Apophysomyces sp. BC1034]
MNERPVSPTLKHQQLGGSDYMADIEHTVTRLLMSTKKLLEGLTAWSVRKVSDIQVEDIYHTLAANFVLATRAFETAQMPMIDVARIPEDLHACLRVVLVQEPSTLVLEQHLPSIRDIILKLLQALKRKQARLRDRAEMDFLPRSPDRLSSSSMGSSISNSSQSRHLSTQSLRTAKRHTGRQENPMLSRSLSTIPRSDAPLPTPTSSSDNAPPRRHGSLSSLRSSSPTPPTPPYPHPTTSMTSGDFDMNDPKTVDALSALRKQENLARRSSVRRQSALYRHAPQITVPSRRFDHLPPVPSIPTTPQDEESSAKIASEIEQGSAGLPLFLQLGQHVKKVYYEGELTMAGLRMLFIEKFNDTTPHDDVPMINIQDPTTRISYELEDVADIRPNALLSLPIKEKLETATIEDIHQKMTEKMDAIREDMVLQIKSLFEENMRHMMEQLQPTEEEKLTTKSSGHITTAISDDMTRQIQEKQLEIDQLRRDLGVLRQVCAEFQKDTGDILCELKQKSMTLKEKPLVKSSAREYVDESKERSEKAAAAITTRLEELQDTIDELKLDVTQRRCRPSAAQLEHCDTEVKTLEKEIAGLSEEIKSFKPVWKKTWESELQNIVKEQQFLKEQEGLLLDLEEDHAALLEVLQQLQKVSEIQARKKSLTRRFRVTPAEEGFEGMSSVLKQVSTIEVDHSRRVKALAQAEKMRARELASRIDEFEKELVTFVDAKKLKRTGGTDEIERQRQKKNQAMLRQLYGDPSAEEGGDGNEKGEAPDDMCSSNAEQDAP